MVETISAVKLVKQLPNYEILKLHMHVSSAHLFTSIGISAISFTKEEVMLEFVIQILNVLILCLFVSLSVFFKIEQIEHCEAVELISGIFS